MHSDATLKGHQEVARVLPLRRRRRCVPPGRAFSATYNILSVIAAHMIIGWCAVLFRAENARSPQEPQMMADQRRRKLRPCCDVGHSDRLLQTGQDDPQPTGIADRPEHHGKLAYVVIGN